MWYLTDLRVLLGARRGSGTALHTPALEIEHRTLEHSLQRATVQFSSQVLRFLSCLVSLGFAALQVAHRHWKKLYQAKQRTWAFPQQCRIKGCQPNAIAVQLLVKAGHVLAVVMPHERERLIDHLVPREHDHRYRERVLAAPGRSPGAKRDVEPAE